MKPKLLIIFLLIALLPVIILGWMGVRIIDAEKVDLERGLEKLYISKLKDHDGTVQKVINQRKRDLLKISSDIEGRYDLPSLLREMVSRNTAVSNCFVLDAKGVLLFPSESMELSENEKLFLQRTKKIWEGKLIPVKNGVYRPVTQTTIQWDNLQIENDIPPNANKPVPQQANQNVQLTQQGREQNSSQQIFQSNYDDRQIQAEELNQQIINTSNSDPFVNGKNDEGFAVPDTGWIGWFWESGIHLIYWIRMSDGRVFGAELDRSDLVADIISELPSTDPFRKDVVSERLILDNASGQSVYQWGTFEVNEKIKPSAVYPLSFPLNTWKLRYYPGDSTDSANFAKSSILNLSIMLAALGIVFIFLALYFYRENAREMREAATRVSFVNRVSHELKTPLTNIRMYAELLNSQIDDDDSKEKKQLAVITGESERLSRLITNVLTFSKEQKGKLQLRKKKGVIDEIISNSVERLNPVLEKAGIKLKTDLNAKEDVNVDADILEQIIVNLISNIEKYASAGESANIATRQDGDKVYITVSDTGPGIAANFAKEIFKPFYRIDNKLSEGTSGTGIGLNIARELARKHGGDIKLLPSDKGAVFEVKLDVG